MMHPFRFGLLFHNTVEDQEYVAAQAKLAETLGYSTFLVPDHLGDQFTPSLTLLHAAHATSTLHVGSFVFANDFRHPALLAKEALTLACFTQGRFELGMGAGWMQSEYHQIGLPFDRPGIRIERLAEAIGLIKACWHSEQVDFSGSYYQLHAFPAIPRPQGMPPLYLGGSGKRMLTLAAQEASIVGFVPRLNSGTRGNHMNALLDYTDITSAALQQKVSWVQEAAGERFEALELSIVLMDVCVTETPQETCAQLAQQYHIDEQLIQDSPFFLVGTLAHILNKLQWIRQRFHISYLVVWEEHLQTLAPILHYLKQR